MFGLRTQDLLALTVIAAIVTTIGNLIATVLKDFLFTRSFERWKARRTLLTIYRKYRDPIVLAGQELSHRLAQVCGDYPPKYLRSEVLATSGVKIEKNSADDPYFMRYRLLSTVYRLCAFLGWLELYRQDLTFLDTGRRSENQRFEDALERFRSDLADGQLNEAENWAEWRDGLIFREEQRAIGEAMITSGTTSRVILGYGAFCLLFERSTSDKSLWPIQAASNFFLDLEKTNDFRASRLEMMKQDLNTMLDGLRAPEKPKALNVRR